MYINLFIYFFFFQKKKAKKTKTFKCGQKHNRAPLWLPHTSTPYFKLSLKIPTAELRDSPSSRKEESFLAVFHFIKAYIVRVTVAINAKSSAWIRCRRDSSILTQLEVGEHTPCRSRSLSPLVSHGVLSLLGNTEVYCSVLVSRLSLSLSLHPPPPPPPLLFSTTLSTQPFATSVRLSLLCISSFPTLSSFSLLLPSSPPPMGIYIAAASTVHSGLEIQHRWGKQGCNVGSYSINQAHISLSSLRSHCKISTYRQESKLHHEASSPFGVRTHTNGRKYVDGWVLHLYVID